MTSAAKSLLVVMRHSPYGGPEAREGLDAVLTAAAFEQSVSILFMDEGVWQLQPGQDTSAVEQKNLSINLPVLPMYDVNALFVDQASLTRRGLEVDTLILPVEPLKPADVADLVQRHDLLLSF